MQITRIREEERATYDKTFAAYLEAKAAADRASHNLKVAQQALIEYMREKHMKSMSSTYQGLKRQVTYVQRETYEIDEKGLKKELTAKVYNKFTTPKLDRKKLEAAMEGGDVDPMLVAKHTKTKQSEPYLKFTEKEVDDEGEDS